MASLAPAVIGPQVWGGGSLLVGILWPCPPHCETTSPSRPVESSPRRVGDEPRRGWARMPGHPRVWGAELRCPRRNDSCHPHGTHRVALGKHLAGWVPSSLHRSPVLCQEEEAPAGIIRAPSGGTSGRRGGEEGRPGDPASPPPVTGPPPVQTPWATSGRRWKEASATP